MNNAGYNRVEKVTHCGFWAHTRRKWREAMPDGAAVKTSKTVVGFQYCTKLFSLEKKCAYADGKSRKDYRQNVVWPLLEVYLT
ncbi:MAG: transposase [Oscillospiraceae bacterium]|nr:transposase [Oscillospiraceae bacterium]